MMDEKYKIVDGKLTTAAVIIINSKGDILACHGTGRSGYDFPKGIVEIGETDIEGAFRELYEETGLDFRNNVLDSNVIDCGVYPHGRRKTKNIHIFLYKTEDFPSLETLRCDSYFERDGKLFPEVDGYLVIEKKDRRLFNEVLQDKFFIIDKFNESEK